MIYQILDISVQKVSCPSSEDILNDIFMQLQRLVKDGKQIRLHAHINIA